MTKTTYDYNLKPQGVLKVATHRLNLNLEDIIFLIDQKLKKQKEITLWEIGCGGGRNLSYLKSLYGNKIKVFGSDISKTAINHAKSVTSGNFKIGKSTQKVFSQKFDLIIILDLLEHLESTKEVELTLKLINSSLVKNGTFYLSVPIEKNIGSHTWLESRLNLPDLTLKYYGHTLKFTDHDIRTLVQKNLNLQTLNYHSHTLSQLNVILTFFIPKMLLNLLGGNKLETNFRDSNIELGKNKSTTSFTLSFIRKVYGIVKLPLNIVSYYESRLLSNLKWGALAVNIIATKK